MCVCVCVCVCVCSEEPLTLVVTLAEFLAEVLGHHAGAGAVTWVLRVVTWLVVIHLIGRIICVGQR